ncbi:Succinate-semialdehyde dehydrogenase (acetylating) [Galdieria sulphuraria]|nr:Succinate-semialdehyde dehydrogenase (acetylating) [Galdieria sulphuraria]
MSLSTMKACVFPGVGQPMRTEILPIPKPQDGEVLVKVAACGVCHTDLHVIKGEVKFPTPAVLGHEISGTIEELGPGVKSEMLKKNQRIVASFIMPCGWCRLCSVGRDDLCENFFNYNRLKGQLYDGKTRLFREDKSPIWMYSMGGLAEYCVVPATAVFPIPQNMPLDTSAILGCAVFTGYGAVRHNADVRIGQRVAVVAAGGIGLNVINWSKLSGASQILALDIDDKKLELAKLMGATHTLRSDNKDIVQKVRELTEGEGVDIAFEALGTRQTFELAMEIIRDSGKVVAIGIAPAGTTASVDIQRLVRRGLQVAGSYGARVRADMPEIVRIVASSDSYKKSITAVYELDEANQAYEDLKNRKIVGRAIVKMPNANFS